MGDKYTFLLFVSSGIKSQKFKKEARYNFNNKYKH